MKTCISSSCCFSSARDLVENTSLFCFYFCLRFDFLSHSLSSYYTQRSTSVKFLSISVIKNSKQQLLQRANSTAGNSQSKNFIPDLYLDTKNWSHVY